MRKRLWLLPLLLGITACAAHAGGDLKPGEIRLLGQVTAVEVAGMSFTMDCVGFSTPQGSRHLDPPKRKVVTVDERTGFTLLTEKDPNTGKDFRWGKLGDVKPGDCVSAEGRDTGTGKPLPAYYVVVTVASRCGEMLGTSRGAAAASSATVPPTGATTPMAPTVGPSEPAQAPAPAAQKGANLPLPLLAGAVVAVLVIAGGMAYVIKLRKRG